MFVFLKSGDLFPQVAYGCHKEEICMIEFIQHDIIGSVEGEYVVGRTGIKILIGWNKGPT